MELVRDTSIQLEAKEVGYEVSRQLILIITKLIFIMGYTNGGNNPRFA